MTNGITDKNIKTTDNRNNKSSLIGKILPDKLEERYRIKKQTGEKQHTHPKDRKQRPEKLTYTHTQGKGEWPGQAKNDQTRRKENTTETKQNRTMIPSRWK